MLFGGAVCSPSCICHNSTVVVDVDTLDVAVYDDSAAGGPLPRYRHTTVGHVTGSAPASASSAAAAHVTSGIVVLFGGERYNPSVYVGWLCCWHPWGARSCASSCTHWQAALP